MPRTDATKVGAIIELDDSIILTPFIEAANELVTEVCPDGALVEGGYTANRLELIERWLAAHFYAIRDPRMSMVAPTGLSVRYQGQTEMGFNHTSYGQQALRLDTKGGLAALDAKAKKGGGNVGLHWLGTEYESSDSLVEDDE
jgi:hypothetical protein